MLSISFKIRFQPYIISNSNFLIRPFEIYCTLMFYKMFIRKNINRWASHFKLSISNYLVLM